jgi:hypothetical protein
MVPTRSYGVLLWRPIEVDSNGSGGWLSNVIECHHDKRSQSDIYNVRAQTHGKRVAEMTRGIDVKVPPDT